MSAILVLAVFLAAILLVAAITTLRALIYAGNENQRRIENDRLNAAFDLTR